jgi:hypothetical protein
MRRTLVGKEIGIVKMMMVGDLVHEMHTECIY